MYICGMLYNLFYEVKKYVYILFLDINFVKVMGFIKIVKY